MAHVDSAQSAEAPAAIVAGKSEAFAETLAVKEVRRYAYVRTGQLLPIVEQMDAAPAGGLIVVGSKGQPAVQALLQDGDLKTTVSGLKEEQYLLKTIRHGDRTIVLVVGGDPVGTLYGAYRLAEHLGVRFYLQGDVVPDRRMAWALPELDEIGRPLFDRRGIQPFHDFPEGPGLVGRRGVQGDPRPVAQAADELLRPAHLSRRRRGAGAADLDRAARAN